MLNDLLLLSGNDIPFAEAQLTIHQPTVKEIGYIGEENFFTGYQMLKVSKNSLSLEDKVDLDKLTNFDILIAILRERNAVMQKNKTCVFMVLSLLFPEYSIKVLNDGIALTKEDNEEETRHISKENFEVFQSILKHMFEFDKDSDTDDFNPDGQMAARIAAKLRKRHQKLAEAKGGDAKKIDIISRSTSILSIGLKIDLKEILNYTVYQLFDQVRRYELKTDYDMYVSAKMAGAQDIKDPEDWMKDIHS